MKQILVAVAIAVAVAVFTAPFTSTPSFALCNKICQAKCTLGWKNEFKSEQECRNVWSRRNGPTGVGCGQKGQPFQRCE
jgi:hypothetical protein